MNTGVTFSNSNMAWKPKLTNENDDLTAVMRNGTAVLAETAVKAQKLAQKRMIALTGEAVGAAMFDGSEDIDIYTSVEALTNEELEVLLK